jgi:hypothetical protein
MKDGSGWIHTIDEDEKIIMVPHSQRHRTFKQKSSTTGMEGDEKSYDAIVSRLFQGDGRHDDRSTWIEVESMGNQRSWGAVYLVAITVSATISFERRNIGAQKRPDWRKYLCIILLSSWLLQSNIQHWLAVDFGATQIIKHVKGLATNNNETQHELALLVRHRFFRDFATCRHDAAQSYHCGILPIKGSLRLIVDAWRQSMVRWTAHVLVGAFIDGMFAGTIGFLTVGSFALVRIHQVGHQADDETPWCLSNARNVTTSFANYDYTDAIFARPRHATLDTNDALNDIDGPAIIDRHACTFLDVNMDGLPDIVCGVGANMGTGNGYNELYLTGSGPNANVTKVLDGHGLQKYTTIR